MATGRLRPRNTATGGSTLRRGARRISQSFIPPSLLTAAVEARALRILESDGLDLPDLVEVRDPELPARHWVMHTLMAPALFVNLEHRQTAQVFGLDPDMVLDRIDVWQQASAAVWDAIAANPPPAIAEVTGICYQSKHRASNGWNFGFFHGKHTQLLRRGKFKAFTWPPPDANR